MGCFDERDKEEMLVLALRCVVITDALIDFIDEGIKERLVYGVRRAIEFFVNGLTYPQLIVFQKQLSRRKLYGELLSLLNPRLPRGKKERAEKVKEFFFRLGERCLWHHEKGTNFGPPSGIGRLLSRKADRP